ncbi:uncharacterized protein LOC130647476 [Hydractinia symbiolongicarpus]|uniref:uncharacterized protein LOC130647476 n=1 Tax=Hydractinia symbiolongicarpus TaxID=13093 RepID=UPI00254A2CA9|nr:uncharacterized protein LOC130647476 [Hydractinia symbiolongicarpus]
MAAKKCLELGFDYFLDISQQIAYKRYIHKKFWNVVLHTVTSLLFTWSAFFILSYIVPSLLLHANLLVVLSICIRQDTLLGLAACLIYPVIYYHAIYMSTASFIQAFSLAALSYIVEVYVGQTWIEGTEPFSTPPKSKNPHFLMCDTYNETFFTFFHNAVTLLIRFDFRSDLLDTSNIYLRKYMDRVKKVP